MVENIKARLVRSIFTLILLFFMKTLLQLAVWNLVKKKCCIAKWSDVRNMFYSSETGSNDNVLRTVHGDNILHNDIFLQYCDNIERLDYNLAKIKVY